MRRSLRLAAMLSATLLLGISPWCYQSMGATPRTPGAPAHSDTSALRPPPSGLTLDIPGPLPPFLRLAGISQQATHEEVLPLLSHQVVLQGYEVSNRSASPTEYLILLRKYVEQARQLRSLAGADGTLRVTTCTQARDLLNVIGYRLAQPCGPSTTLAAADSKRAFLTVDSGFPLVDLEKTLQSGKPFAYSFPTTPLPVLFGSKAWTETSSKKADDLLDALLSDPALARLYWALTKMDDETQVALRNTPGLQRLLPLAPRLDFFGEQLRIRAGRVLVPGGAKAEPAWENLVGVSPRQPGQFVVTLFSKDKGWIAPYYDALSRVSAAQQAYFTDSHRLARFYQSFRGREISANPARSVFRSDPELVLLISRMPLDADGQPHVPGNLNVWSELEPRTKKAESLTTPERLIELLFSLSRNNTSTGLLESYLVLCEIDRARADGQQLSPQTALLLAKNFAKYRDHYLTFSEFGSLNDESLTLFINTAEAISHIPEAGLRAEATGMMQAQIGLWQILARQGEISMRDQNSSWQGLLRPFGETRTFPALYDATRASLADLMLAATGSPQVSQDEIIETVSGPAPTNPARAQVRQEIANRMRRVLDAQRLVSLDTLLKLGNGLPRVARGEIRASTLLPFAQELREFEMPKPIFSTGERLEWTPGYFGDAHTQAEIDTNIDELLRQTGASKEVADARGRLVPFLRDFLVGLNYAYYEPPQAQMLHNNALFIRRHDFSGDVARGSQPPWSTPGLVGRGETSGGGVRLSGGLAGLPYVLAEVEQQFVVPRNIQSLVWEDLVPSLMVSAVLPRWWQVTRPELHAVALYQQVGEDLVQKAGADPSLREKVVGVMSDRLLSRRLWRLERSLAEGHPEQFMPVMTPAESFYLAQEFQHRYPEEVLRLGSAGQELQNVLREDPLDTNDKRLATDFGVPHPALAQTTARELLDLRPLPTFLGFSSRLLAECWQSNNLYWARLADEKGLPPEQLHELVPALTLRMAEDIFASDLDDWPALGRAMRQVGNEFREGKLEPLPKISTSPSL